MLAESGEKRAAKEAAKIISRFSQVFQSEKFLLDGLCLSYTIGGLSLSLAVGSVPFLQISSTEASGEAREESRFLLGMFNQAR